jgi:antitoxin YqcF
MSDVTIKNKTIAKAAYAAIGGKPKPEISRYWDENNKSFVDIMLCEDRPEKGVNTVATIGISDHPLFQGGEEYRDDEGALVRAEILGSYYKKVKVFPNIIATAAFFVINSKWFCAPHAIFPDIVSMYLPRASMKHLMFFPPFLWEDLKTMEFDGVKVAWLMAIPISESEYQFAIENTTDKLGELFEENDIDYFDLNRKPVV